MTRAFIDTNVPMYAGGTEHALRDGARRVVLAAADGRLDVVTDSEVLREILYGYLHTGEREKGFTIFASFYRIMLGRVLPVEAADA